MNLNSRVKEVHSSSSAKKKKKIQICNIKEVIKVRDDLGAMLFIFAEVTQYKQGLRVFREF